MFANNVLLVASLHNRYKFKVPHGDTRLAFQDIADKFLPFYKQ